MTRLRSKRLWGGAAVVLALAAILWLYLEASAARSMTDPDTARKLGQPIPVRTAYVTEAEIDAVIGATAVTIPSELANVRIGPSRGMSQNSPVSDIVVKHLHIQEGTYVEQGQVLVEMEDQVIQEVLKQKEVTLASAKSQLEFIKEQTPLNKRIRELTLNSAESGIKFRTEDLENRKFVHEALAKMNRDKAASFFEFYDSRARLSQARFDLARADTDIQLAQNQFRVGELTDKRDLAKAQSDYEVARIEYELAKRDVERARVKSPLTGFVSKVNVVPGSVVSVTEVLAQVVKLDPIHVRLDYPQERLDDVFVGQKAEVILDSFPQETFVGSVIRIHPEVNPNLRIVPVIVELPNPSNRLRAGISGYARLHKARKAVTVPELSLMQQQGKTVVFCVDKGRARVREVQLGSWSQNGFHEVRQGLTPGEEVVIHQSNFYKNYGKLTKRDSYLMDNDLVNTDWRRWARRD